MSSDVNNALPQVPDFDLVRQIGEGGFGEVWLAVNRTTGHARAVKVIALGRSQTRDPAGREIGAVTQLESRLQGEHPNLLEILHVGRTDSHLFYVMELADDDSGQPGDAPEHYRSATLEGRLARGPCEPDECLGLARQLLEGLAGLHAAGMVHRDVKPSNCLFVRGVLKLADFGLLTLADPSVSRLGTQRYMPPDGVMDTRADVYAAGLVLYEMLTGLPAECFPSLGARARQIADSPLLERLNHLVLRACERDPQKRFCHAREMLAALCACDSPAPPRRVRRRWLLAAFGALAVAAAAAFALWPRGPAVVEVNFITHPYEAVVLLDGQPVLAEDGRAWRTPCSVPDLPARACHVAFRLEGRDDLDVGEIDFRRVREVEARWQESTKQK